MFNCLSLLWKWWCARNKVNAGESTCGTATVALLAGRCAAEYGQLHAAQKEPTRRPQCWSPPVGEIVKIDIYYGSFAGGAGGWVFVIRDQETEMWLCRGQVGWTPYRTLSKPKQKLAYRLSPLPKPTVFR